ncbi:MAG: hypothetical protein EZS26_000316 [Candidatus Ordinivivax streblomastigis]|uniref:Peptidase M60 domain-containing protein n=1 Tax=Candidatus Ordinivivax streblomastigis TaxID=2540710 RepID=A0A5M8P5F5_9BACT|nr:MAG: hypothetical protein EZS26_000316 [Candidatus Ordinivivax streblomastigis]
MKKIIVTFLVISVLLPLRMLAAITTPYPTTIEIKQIYSAEHERIRLCQGHKKFDQQPTGFYVDSLSKVVVNVEVITPAKDGAMPTIHIGTLGFNVGGRGKVDVALKAGLNTITPAQKKAAGPGGLIYFSFVTNNNAQPEGKVRITFTDESEQVRAPRFVHLVTTNTEFKEMMDTYTTPDVQYYSDYAMVAATRAAALTNSYETTKNKVAWLNDINLLLAREDSISGMDNNDPNPVHHRLNAGEIRYLLVQNTSASPHANSIGYTGYPTSYVHRYLTVFGSSNNSWALGHELGHQHQQPAYQIPQSTESTVNIYSYTVEKPIWEAAHSGLTYNRTTAERWITFQTTYLQYTPIEDRIYDMPDATLKALMGGVDQNELRFAIWEQFFLLFGNDFYKTLHRVVREEKVTGGSEQERRFYLIWKASQVSGYDLREFCNQWGIRVTDAALKIALQKNFEAALASGAIVDLPYSTNTILRVTGQNRPEWSPLPLRGITSSQTTVETLDPSDWTITTSKAGEADATVGGNQPEYIIDQNMTTCFSFSKSGETPSSGSVGPSFTINMKNPQSFNYFIYKHRISNTYEQLRARKISFYGKNAESDAWTIIKVNHVINYVTNKNEIRVDFDKVTYQYVKLVINDWNTGAGNTVQVAEFEMGIDHSTDIGDLDPETAINKFTTEGNVVSTQYYNLQGIEINSPTTTGIYIQKDYLDTNKVHVTKKMMR